jgi:hypothetical protein
MRTRPREVVRMLAALRHSAQCRTLRAAKAREAMLQAKEETDEAEATEDDDVTQTPPEAGRLHRPH